MTDNLPELPEPSIEDAYEAIDSLDDYARMTVGVDALGPVKSLRRFVYLANKERNAACAFANNQARRSHELGKQKAHWKAIAKGLLTTTQHEHAEKLEAKLSQTTEALQAERARADALKTVMIAAAEEIAAHWESHCDAEGYGPQNLLRRLEEGIPSEYGYTAGAFAELKKRADALEAALSDVLEMAQEHADHFAAAFAGYKPERHAYYARALATARALLEKT